MKAILIIIFLLLVYFFFIKPQEHKLLVSRLHHGEAIKVKYRGSWQHARYYCGSQFKNKHKVIIDNNVILVEEKNIKFA